MKMMKVHVTVWLVLLLGGFLGDSSRNISRIVSCGRNWKLHRKRSMPCTFNSVSASCATKPAWRCLNSLVRTMVWQEITSETITNKLKDLTEMVQDPGLKKSLQDLSATHDTITADLASANASALAAWQPVVLKTIDATKNVR